MKTNTPLNPETQVCIYQLKRGVDWHVEQFHVVRMCNGQSPQTRPTVQAGHLPRHREKIACLGGPKQRCL
jgi:hypothetical protein